MLIVTFMPTEENNEFELVERFVDEIVDDCRFFDSRLNYSFFAQDRVLGWRSAGSPITMNDRDRSTAIRNSSTLEMDVLEDILAAAAILDLSDPEPELGKYILVVSNHQKFLG